MIDAKDIDPLIYDEYEAIDGYVEYLKKIKKEPEYKEVSKVINEIIADEQDHISKLKKLNKNYK